MNVKAATMSVTRMQTAPILLDFIIAPVKKDLLGMDTHAQVEIYSDAMVQYSILMRIKSFKESLLAFSSFDYFPIRYR